MSSLFVFPNMPIVLSRMQKTLERISRIVDAVKKLSSNQFPRLFQALNSCFLGDRHPHNIYQFIGNGSVCWLRPTSGPRVIPIHPGIKGPWAVKMGPVIREFVTRRVANWHPDQTLLGVTTSKKHYASQPG